MTFLRIVISLQVIVLSRFRTQKCAHFCWYGAEIRCAGNLVGGAVKIAMAVRDQNACGPRTVAAALKAVERGKARRGLRRTRQRDRTKGGQAGSQTVRRQREHEALPQFDVHVRSSGELSADSPRSGQAEDDTAHLSVGRKAARGQLRFPTARAAGSSTLSARTERSSLAASFSADRAQTITALRTRSRRSACREKR